MTLAVQTGVPHTVWIKDPAAMGTAVRVLQQIADARKGMG